MRIERIKQDLRQLKKTAHAIEGLCKLQATHQRRIDMLKRLKGVCGVEEAIEREMQFIRQLDIPGKLQEAREIEEKYLKIIESLEPIDKAIIIDSYLNGVPYWKIGDKLGFSEEGVRKRIQRALKKLATA